MFSNQFNIPKQHYRVDTYPSVEELQGYVEQAGKIRGIKHCFNWVPEEGSDEKFTLTIYLKEGPGEPEWWMHKSSKELGANKMLWFHKSNDLAIIYPQIMEAVGAPNPLADEEEEPEETRTLTEKLQQQAAAAGPYATPGSTIRAKELQAAAANKPPLSKLLSGDLATLPVSSILSTARQEDATGRLLIQCEAGEAIVQFIHGQPVHATTQMNEGLESLIELFTWQEGNVTFTQGTKPEKTTIQTPVDQILYKGAELIENIAMLQECDINESTVVKRASNQLSEKEFEHLILQGPPLGLELQKRFYQSLDGNRSLKDVATFLSLSASQWIAVAANLLSLRLLQSPNGKIPGTQNQPEMQAPPAQSAPAGMISGNFQASDQSASGTQPAYQPTGHPLPPSQTTSANPASAPPSQVPPGPAKDPRVPPGQETTGDIPPQQNKPGLATHARTEQAKAVESRNQFQKQLSSQLFTRDSIAGVKKNSLQPPASTFSPPGAMSGDSSASPAVEAFMSSSSTVEIYSDLKIGVQTEEVKYDAGAVKAIWSGLCNSETLVYTSDALQFFLEKEFNRAFHFSSVFSLIVFSIKEPTASNRSASETVRDVVRAIGKIKNDVDILGHFGEKGFGLILPNHDNNHAVMMVDKITTNLTKFAPGLAKNRPTIFFGIASVPSDAKDLPSIMSNAQVAMIEASKRNVTRVQFNELSR